jgi:hypothetical protein
MIKKIAFGTVFALVFAGLMAPSASAICANSTSVSTYNPITGAFSYWHTTLTGAGTTLVAKIWQPGGPDVTGTCNTRNSPDGNAGILYFGLTAGDIGLSVNLADACVGGTTATCPVGQLAVLATVNKGGVSEFLTTQAPDSNGGAITFDFSTFGNHPMVAVPRPRITSSSKAGSTVNTTITVDPVSSGAYEGTAGLITGYNILSKLANADPGRLASSYDTGPTIAASGGISGTGPVPVDCTGGSATLSRRFVVTQIVTAGGPSPTVGPATQVSCDSSLATPPNYKIVPKPKVELNSKSKQ